MRRRRKRSALGLAMRQWVDLVFRAREAGPGRNVFSSSSITSASRGIFRIAFSIFSGMSRGPRRRSLPPPQTARSNKPAHDSKARAWPHHCSVAKKLPGLFVADLFQQRLPVLDVLFVFVRGEPV